MVFGVDDSPDYGSAVIAAEFQRHAQGQSIPEWDAANPDLMQGPGAAFLKFFRSSTPESLRATMESLPVQDTGSALFSSPAQRGVDYSVTKSILNGSYERTEADEAAARAFQREIRKDADLRRQLGNSPPEIVNLQGPRQRLQQRIGAAILAELSGKSLLVYRAKAEKITGGVTIPGISGYVFVHADHPSIPAAAGHEAWHRLWVDHRRDTEKIGGLIKEQLTELQMESAKVPHLRNYGDELAEQEVGASLFSSIVTNPAFWRAYGTPNSAAIADAIEEMGGIPQYSEARLVRDWPSLVKETARILRTEEPTSLFSSPASGEFAFDQTTDAGDASQKGLDFDQAPEGVAQTGPHQAGFEIRPRNIVEGFMSPDFRYVIGRDFKPKEGHRLITSEFAEYKEGKYKVGRYRLMLVENEDGC